MVFPISPFGEDFDLNSLSSLKGDDYKEKIQNDVQQLLKWLCTFPKITTYRVNTLKISKTVALENIQARLKQIKEQVFKAECCDNLPDVILLNHLNINVENFKKYENEIVVDVDCAAAVLRGAHIYAPGILGMISGTRIGDKVSIYADLYKKCRKGLAKIFTDGEKIFIGNGIVKMSRQNLFGENLCPKGIAIEVLETLSGCPSIGDDFLPTGWVLLQNLPSVICVHVLNPQKYDVVLDMCAAPGNKTTHIAALMNNEGTLIALDKTLKKIEQLNQTCNKFEAQALTFVADSTKITADHSMNNYRRLEDGPPFVPAIFDKILLDAPCSALGKRPQLSNRTSEKVIRSYVPLQRKLFKTAVNLLKPGGTLVYSTCTITLAENEGIVAWALRTFDSIELVKPELSLGGPGWFATTMTEEDRKKVQRFGPDQQCDSVGFFIACFLKKSK